MAGRIKVKKNYNNHIGNQTTPFRLVAQLLKQLRHRVNLYGAHYEIQNSSYFPVTSDQKVC